MGMVRRTVVLGIAAAVAVALLAPPALASNPLSSFKKSINKTIQKKILSSKKAKNCPLKKQLKKQVKKMKFI
jgi:hypothetical protein